MCWDEKTSWMTFALGTSFNILNVMYFKTPKVIALSAIWQYVLTMQFFEAKTWRSLKTPNVKSPPSKIFNNSNSAQGAMIFNITQPIVVGFILLTVSKAPIQNKILSIGVLILYTCWTLWSLNNTKKIDNLKPSGGCKHLVFEWWGLFPGGAIPYFIALYTAIILLLRPMKTMIFQIMYITISFLISAKMYRCGVGSVWCWFAAFAPIASFIFEKYNI